VLSRHVIAGIERPAMIALKLYDPMLFVGMAWDVAFHPDFEAEFAGLAEAVQDELLQHAGLLAAVGPSLGRPTVDTIKGSRIANLKELRFAAEGGVWRVLFAFNRQRIAVLPVAGDKRGRSESRFYQRLIVVAEQRRKIWE